MRRATPTQKIQHIRRHPGPRIHLSNLINLIKYLFFFLIHFNPSNSSVSCALNAHMQNNNKNPHPNPNEQQRGDGGKTKTSTRKRHAPDKRTTENAKQAHLTETTSPTAENRLRENPGFISFPRRALTTLTQRS